MATGHDLAAAVLRETAVSRAPQDEVELQKHPPLICHRRVAGPEIERLDPIAGPRCRASGPRSARRAALALIKKREPTDGAAVGRRMQTAMERISICRVCGNIDNLRSLPRCASTNGATPP